MAQPAKFWTKIVATGQRISATSYDGAKVFFGKKIFKIHFQLFSLNNNVKPKFNKVARVFHKDFRKLQNYRSHSTVLEI